MQVFNGDLYLVADDGVDGTELWRTDGTTTEQVADINPGSESSSPQSLFVANGALYFSADNGADGEELWRTDGTNTELVADINPGGAPSIPWGMTATAEHLMFVATTVNYGGELWVYNFVIDDVVSWSPSTSVTLAQSPHSFAPATSASSESVTYTDSPGFRGSSTTATFVISQPPPPSPVTPDPATPDPATPDPTTTPNPVTTPNPTTTPNPVATPGTRKGAPSSGTPGTKAPSTGTPGTATPGTTNSNASTAKSPSSSTHTFVAADTKKPVTPKAILNYLGVKTPKSSKVTITVKKSSSKICKATASGIKYLKPGKCAFSVLVDPPKGRNITRSGTLTMKAAS